jgi:hypothetical protein
MTMIDETVKASANELDSRDRYILLWIERQVAPTYNEVSGETLDILVARHLVKLNPNAKPRPYWTVTCTGLGLQVAEFLRTYKTIAAPKRMPHG